MKIIKRIARPLKAIFFHVPFVLNRAQIKESDMPAIKRFVPLCPLTFPTKKNWRIKKVTIKIRIEAKPKYFLISISPSNKAISTCLYLALFFFYKYVKTPSFFHLLIKTTLSHNHHTTLTKRSQNSFVMCLLLFYHLYWEKI
jgi:hypothetical protein